MTRRSLFAMLLGIGAAPAVVVASRWPGSWFVERIRRDPRSITIRSVDPPLLLREEGALRPFPLRSGSVSFHVEELRL